MLSAYALRRVDPKANAQAMASWETIVLECRRLSDLGKYDEATHKLRQFLESDGLERLHAVAELAKILRNQGYWRDSYDILQKEVKKIPSEAKESPVYLQLEMDACLLRPIVLASFDGVLDRAAEVFQGLLTMRDAGKLHELHPSWVCSPCLQQAFQGC